jgi:hypothetical protein
MKKSIMGLLVITAALLATYSTGCAGCTDEDKADCTNEHTTCVNACDPLGANYSACVSTCDTELNTCLDDAGCE